MRPYTFKSHGDFSFEFTTDRGIVYNATFFDYDSLFPDYPEFTGNIYSFTLDIVDGDRIIQQLDERTGETVVAIFQHFFTVMQRVIVYVCDSSDERHIARKKKFDFWFWKYNDGTIIKEDGVAVIADFEIYNSILIHRQNKFADKIIAAFKTLNERADDK